MAVDPGEAAHDVHGPVREDLEEIAVVDDFRDDVLHVVRLRRCVGDEVEDPVAYAIRIISGLEERRVLEVVRRQEREEVANLLET